MEQFVNQEHFLHCWNIVFLDQNIINLTVFCDFTNILFRNLKYFISVPEHFSLGQNIANLAGCRQINSVSHLLIKRDDTWYFIMWPAVRLYFTLLSLITIHHIQRVLVCGPQISRANHNSKMRIPYVIVFIMICAPIWSQANSINATCTCAQIQICVATTY